MDWTYILISFLLNSVIAIILGKIIESVFEKRIISLQHNHSVELAKINSEITHLQMIHITKFNELHQRRAIAILEIYKLLAKAEKILTIMAFPFRFKGEGQEKLSVWDRLAPVRNATYAVSEYFSENKILFSPNQVELLEEIDKIFQDLDSFILMQEIHSEKPSSEDEKKMMEHLKEPFSEAKEQFDIIYPKIKRILEEDFRNTLGFDIENK